MPYHAFEMQTQAGEHATFPFLRLKHAGQKGTYPFKESLKPKGSLLSKEVPFLGSFWRDKTIMVQMPQFPLSMMSFCSSHFCCYTHPLRLWGVALLWVWCYAKSYTHDSISPYEWRRLWHVL